jgi:5,10-methenyltetrahydrofolate synthetase
MAAGSNPEMHVRLQTKTHQAERDALRSALIERRLALSASDYVRLSAAICGHLQASFPQLAEMRVAFCWPVRKEPDLLPLLSAWRANAQAGFSALLPVVIQPDAPLAFRAWTAQTALEKDRYGIPTPAGGDFVVPEALLLPLNAFDAAGYRLGYGGGYFDRTLAALRKQGPPPLAIGVGFELARVDSIHPGAHDQPLDAVLTEAGVFRVPASL